MFAFCWLFEALGAFLIVTDLALSFVFVVPCALPGAASLIPPIGGVSMTSDATTNNVFIDYCRRPLAYTYHNLSAVHFVTG